ncbi:D-hexose-6-phosphate mutarotase [Halopseudomonas nanhaiensis]|uniref:D-hexose-6-phosphate mutarotase n=1 Tax=Halopseudomonas nanhaiensis TaxID=2830842 RepID=UPI001CBB063C|nr:D-hexose-6-phosphate mutarotase [Halopseudomonas nanhaiensis]UAW99916.1 D-hexose-6-phosphate mutarotase [Halopseudomonas nanhaiensis]
MQARIALEGAHIISCVPAGQGDLLWMSPVDEQKPGTPLRGGIPICWPWFGNERPGPSHGIARTSRWNVAKVLDTGSDVVLTLELPRSDIKAQLPDEDWSLQVEFVLGKSLRMSLTTVNTGSKPQRLSQALHSYLPVRDIREARIWGLEGAEFLDQLTGVDRVRQQGAVTFSGEVDRIYQGHSATIQLEGGSEHYLIVQRQGSQSVVVWNPWVDKSARLGHFPPDGYKTMVCIEAANAGSDGRVLAPGQSHRLQTEIVRV